MTKKKVMAALSTVLAVGVCGSMLVHAEETEKKQQEALTEIEEIEMHAADKF